MLAILKIISDRIRPLKALGTPSKDKAATLVASSYRLFYLKRKRCDVYEVPFDDIANLPNAPQSRRLIGSA